MKEKKNRKKSWKVKVLSFKTEKATRLGKEEAALCDLVAPSGNTPLPSFLPHALQSSLMGLSKLRFRLTVSYLRAPKHKKRFAI